MLQWTDEEHLEINYREPSSDEKIINDGKSKKKSHDSETWMFYTSFIYNLNDNCTGLQRWKHRFINRVWMETHYETHLPTSAGRTHIQYVHIVYKQYKTWQMERIFATSDECSIAQITTEVSIRCFSAHGRLCLTSELMRNTFDRLLKPTQEHCRSKIYTVRQSLCVITWILSNSWRREAAEQV